MPGVNVRIDQPFPLASRAAGTFNSQGNAMPESFTVATVMVEATVVGTSLDVKYQMSPNEGTTWFDHPAGAVPQVTAAGNKAYSIVDSIGSFYRLQAVNVGSVTSRCWVEFKR